MRVFMGGKVERIQNKSKKEADCPKRKQSKAADNKEKAFCSFRHEDLRLQPIQHPRERYRLSHVFDAAHPCGAALDSHAEAAVRDRAVASKIEIPFERFARKLMRLKSLDQVIERRGTLTAADDLTVAFRCKQIDSERVFRIVL